MNIQGIDCRTFRPGSAPPHPQPSPLHPPHRYGVSCRSRSAGCEDAGPRVAGGALGSSVRLTAQDSRSAAPLELPCVPSYRANVTALSCHGDNIAVRDGVWAPLSAGLILSSTPHCRSCICRSSPHLSSRSSCHAWARSCRGRCFNRAFTDSPVHALGHALACAHVHSCVDPLITILSSSLSRIHPFIRPHSFIHPPTLSFRGTIKRVPV